jgi:hypothetical protein
MTQNTQTKLPPRYAQLHGLLSKPTGATIIEIAKALGLQNHSVRGMLSTARSKRGWELTKTTDEKRGTVFTLGSITTSAEIPADPAKAKKAKGKLPPKPLPPAGKRKAAPKPAKAAPMPGGLGDLIKAKLAAKA